MVDVIVSPYESDAQLTFLTKTKMAQAVLTEDSDLIAFGCEKVGRLFYFRQVLVLYSYES